MADEMDKAIKDESRGSYSKDGGPKPMKSAPEQNQSGPAQERRDIGHPGEVGMPVMSSDHPFGGHRNGGLLGGPEGAPSTVVKE